ncbi:hypothetical protein O2K51_14495 [Apibacter raozihei]|uniref:hypothetical protein n=1 Tax=Apibacter raozihei TaxID=2500547 RepID=UPI000FE3505B|nr:hypothetical protein [Apibacter raozihei]
MKNSILVILILFLTSCKTTNKDYSVYSFIDDGIQSEKYEMVTLVPEKYELKNMLGYSLTRGMLSPVLEKKTWDMPLLYYNKKNRIFYIIHDRKNSKVYFMKYDFLSNKTDTIKNEDSIKVYNKIFKENYKKSSDLVNFKYPEAEKYYKVLNEEYHSEISEEKRNQLLNKYKNESDTFKEMIIENSSSRYNTTYAELQMPLEKIYFKFNSDLDKNVKLFGNEELYKKGYIFIYIYNNLNMFPHSRGLYLVRLKEKK